MAKFTKVFTFLTMLLMLVTLTSCSDKFVEDWNAIGADLPEDNIFNSVDEDTAKSRFDNAKANKDDYVLIFASTYGANSTDAGALNDLQEVFEYFTIDDLKLDVFDHTDYIKGSKAERTEFREKFGLANIASPNGSYLLVLIVVDGEVKYNTSLNSQYEESGELVRFFVEGNEGSKTIDYSMMGTFILELYGKI